MPLQADGISDPQEHQEDAQLLLDEALEFCEASQDFWGQGDFENAIASLDKAYSLILRAETGDDSDLSQQKEDIRYLISKRMLEIYASRHTVVVGKHDAIPLDINAEVQKEIEHFQGDQRRFFLQAYQRSGRYRADIVKALKQAGLPKELSWLPLIESGFKVRAFSRARALGLWQFIPSTGYRFGLKRDKWIDERMDVDKSTQAAIAYLQELHRIFGDWCTVLAAYNCGENRVLRVIRDQNVNYLDNFWDLYARLPQETRRYVPRFLAVLLVIDDPKKLGIELKTLDRAQRTETLTISKQVRLSEVAKVLGVETEQLEALNPELRRQITPPAAYQLKLPVGQAKLLADKLDSLPVYTPPRPRYAYHRILQGETLSHLAQRYRVSIRAIAKANRMQLHDLLRVGQKVRIPLKTSTRVRTNRNRSRRPTKKDMVGYIVQSGDSLWLIARKHNASVHEIMRLNGLKNPELHLGQKLRVPKKTNRVKLQNGTKIYVVRPGDSPYEIAMQHDMRLERFLRINRLTPRSTIFPGQNLLVDDK